MTSTVDAAEAHAALVAELTGRAIERGADPAVVRRFLEKTQLDPNTGCLLWTAARTGAGYGGFRLNGRLHNAHRLSFELFTGDVPAGLVVRHRCHRPACVHPEHVHTGTHRENSQDQAEAGRWGLPSVRLTDAEAVAAEGLCQLGHTQQEVADMIGVSRARLGVAVRRVRAGIIKNPEEAHHAL